MALPSMPERTPKDDARTDGPGDEPAEPDTASKPGILYSSMTDLRGYKLSPNGTALGLGAPSPLAEPDLEPARRAAKYSERDFDQVRRMLGRLDAKKAPEPLPVETGPEASAPASARAPEARAVDDPGRRVVPPLAPHRIDGSRHAPTVRVAPPAASPGRRRWRWLAIALGVSSVLAAAVFASVRATTPAASEPVVEPTVPPRATTATPISAPLVTPPIASGAVAGPPVAAASVVAAAASPPATNPVPTTPSARVPPSTSARAVAPPDTPGLGSSKAAPMTAPTGTDAPKASAPADPIINPRFNATHIQPGS